jgi:hypothetical protein
MKVVVTSMTIDTAEPHARQENALAEWPAEGPTWRPLSVIHRAGDSWITFHSKTPRWRNLGGLRVRELEEMFPSLVSELVADSYYSLNSFQGPARPARGLVAVRRAETCLLHLNVLFTDLDCYRHGLEPGQGIGEMITLQDRGRIPPVSVFIRSGRGCWALWLLANEEDTAAHPEGASSERVALYRRVQAKLAELLAHLGADRGARDAARVCRIPGSVNSVAPRGSQRVRYLWQAAADGGGFFYTLPAMARLLGISEHEERSYVSWRRRVALGQHHQPPHHGEHGGVVLARQPAKRRGWVARWQAVLDDLARLEDHRGGFQEGVRHHAILILALAGSKILISEALEREVLALAARCRPPLPQQEALAELDAARKWIRSRTEAGPITYQRILELLKVSPEEEAILEHWSRRPSPDPRKVRRARLMDSLREMIGQGGRCPTILEAVERLRQRGVSVSARTMARLYRDLRLSSRKPLLPRLPPHSKDFWHAPPEIEQRPRTQAERVAARNAAIDAACARILARGGKPTVRDVQAEMDPPLSIGTVHRRMADHWALRTAEQQGLDGSVTPRRRHFGVEAMPVQLSLPERDRP